MFKKLYFYEKVDVCNYINFFFNCEIIRTILQSTFPFTIEKRIIYSITIPSTHLFREIETFKQ